MKYKSFLNEVILQILVYMVLGIIAVPIGIIYAAALATGYNAQLTLILLLVISVPSAWFIRPHIERWLSSRLLEPNFPNVAASDCENVQITSSPNVTALTATVSRSLLIRISNAFEIQVSPKGSITAMSESYHVLKV